jgi:hypothetical protein
MKAYKKIEVLLDKRDRDYIHSVYNTCIELRVDAQKEINEINKSGKKEENSERLDYLHQILKPTQKWFSRNLFDRNLNHAFEFGELKHYMRCLGAVLNVKLLNWEKHLNEAILQKEKVSSENVFIVEQSIFYAEQQIVQIKEQIKRLHNIFQRPEDDRPEDDKLSSFAVNASKHREHWEVEMIDLKPIDGSFLALEKGLDKKSRIQEVRNIWNREKYINPDVAKKLVIEEIKNEKNEKNENI